MGAAESTSLQPDELAIFKKLPQSNNTYQADIEIPERPENRVPTDKKYTIVLGVMLLVLLPFVIYTICYSDIDRYGAYDQCGNICGKKNPAYDQWACTGRDYTNERLLQFDDKVNSIEPLLTPRHCVSRCEFGYGEILPGYCSQGNFGSRSHVETTELEVEQWANDLSAFLKSMTWRLTLLCFLSLGIALSMLYLFRVAAAAMVWSILAGVIVFLVIFVGVLWYGYFQTKNSEGLMILPIFFTVLLVILLAVMVFLYRKIFLVIVIFKEAMKATFAMPRLLLIPVLTFLADLLVGALFVTAMVYMLSAGVLTEIGDTGFLKYYQNIVMKFSIAFSFWMMFWVSQFLTGIQYMVIAGAVSKWYFAKNKDHLGSPISTSAAVTFKFHLGSIAFGSLILTLMAIVRSLLSSLVKNKILKVCVDACLGSIEAFLKYLSKNAYIMTAMHGKPFFKSGKRAARILLKNVVNIAVLNYIGDFVIFMAHVLVVLISMLLTYLIMQGVNSPHTWIVYLIVAFVSLVVAVICFSIFETAIDTIYLCFCEDKLLNDGMARPYAMSRDLMEFIENSKKVFGEKKT